MSPASPVLISASRNVADSLGCSLRMVVRRPAEREHADDALPLPRFGGVVAQPKSARRGLREWPAARSTTRASSAGNRGCSALRHARRPDMAASTVAAKVPCRAAGAAASRRRGSTTAATSGAVGGSARCERQELPQPGDGIRAAGAGRGHVPDSGRVAEEGRAARSRRSHHQDRNVTARRAVVAPLPSWLGPRCLLADARKGLVRPGLPRGGQARR